jgi:hypothetical protein
MRCVAAGQARCRCRGQRKGTAIGADEVPLREPARCRCSCGRRPASSTWAGRDAGKKLGWVSSTSAATRGEITGQRRGEQDLRVVAGKKRAYPRKEEARSINCGISGVMVFVFELRDRLICALFWRRKSIWFLNDYALTCWFWLEYSVFS